MRVLSILATARDRALTRSALRAEWPELEWLEVNEEGAFEVALSKHACDLVVASDRLAWTTGAAALRLVRECWPQCTAILLGLAEPELDAPPSPGLARLLRSPRNAGILLALASAESREHLWAAPGKNSRDGRHSRKTGGVSITERRLRTLLQTGAACVKTIDRRARLLGMNAAGLELIEAERRTDIVGKNVLRLIAPEHRRAFHELNRRVFRGERGDLEFELVGLRGTRRWVHAHAAPVFGEDGRVLESLIVTLDLSVRHAVEEKLREHQKRSLHGERLESLGLLAGGIAHDFNNSLTSILGFSELLLQALPSGPQARHVTAIRDAGRSAASLTRQLLAFGGRQVLAPCLLDPSTLLESLSQLIERLIGENIVLRLELGAENSLVRVDPGKLEQVLVNLVINARDAMPDGGQLTLATRQLELDQEARQTMGLARAGWYVCIEIRDTGQGMSPETQAHAFEPFFTTKEPGAGTGLGLSSSYGIVRQSDGGLSMESAIGRGSVFRVFLPRVEGRPEWPPARESGLEALQRGTESVLVVEDDHTVLDLVEKVLLSCGYSVQATDSPGRALGTPENGGPKLDLLLTDLVMPGMCGRDLAARLQERQPDMRVLFMSGYPDAVTTSPVRLESGVNLLAKPFSPSELARAVRRVLDAKSVG